MDDQSAIRVGIVGCGNIGHHHAERYQAAGATYDRGSNELTIHDTKTTGATHMLDSPVETGENDSHADELDYSVDHVATGEAPD